MCILEWKKGEANCINNSVSVVSVAVHRCGKGKVIPSLPVKCKVPSPPTGAGRDDPGFPELSWAQAGPDT